MKNMRITTLALLLASTFGSNQLHAADRVCAQTGENAPLAHHKHWIMEGWEKKKGDPSFVFAKKMQRYYDLHNPTGVFYDNFAPGENQLFDNAAMYGANWEALQDNAESVLHALTEGHSQLMSDKVASTTIGFVGTINTKSKDIIAFNGRSQLAWECHKGEWKIRQEMNYAWEVKPEEIAHYYASMEAKKK